MRLFALLVCFGGTMAGQDSGQAAGQIPLNDLTAAMAAGNAAYLHGKYADSLTSYEQAWQLADQTPSDNPVRYDVLRRLSSVHAAAGEYNAAESYILLAIEWRETILGPNDPKLADDLIQSMTLYRSMHLSNSALAMLTRAMRIHSRISGMDSVPVADDFSRMSLIDLDQTNLAAAAQALESAIEIRTRLTSALDGSLIYDLDRLGTVEITQRAYDKAEATYRHALVIRETLYGKDSAELISTVDGLAYACFGELKYDDAAPIYQRLIDLWVKSAGEEHPVTATALDKVAVFYLAQSKYEQAREATQRANAIRTKALANGLSQEAAEEYGQSNWEAAATLFERALKVMDTPNPMFTELRMQAEGNLKAIKTIQDSAPKTPAKKSTTPKK